MLGLQVLEQLFVYKMHDRKVSQSNCANSGPALAFARLPKRAAAIRSPLQRLPCQSVRRGAAAVMRIGLEPDELFLRQVVDDVHVLAVSAQIECEPGHQLRTIRRN